MDTVFITHSRHDAPILSHIHQLIQEARVSPIFYRYDVDLAMTAWEEILRAIRNSQALFVMLSNNLSSSAHTQNWVGMEVGIACALGKPVWVFEELQRQVSFPIPYLTDYVPYDLSNPQLRILISSAARAYNMRPQRAGMVGFGALGALLFGPAGLVGGAILGALVARPQQPPYVNLLCYHLDCKLRFRSYVWLDVMECPACRRTLRFQTQALPDGRTTILPSPNRLELVYSHYVWFDPQGSLQFYEA